MYASERERSTRLYFTVKEALPSAQLVGLCTSYISLHASETLACND
jgi:hypothetical protein